MPLPSAVDPPARHARSTPKPYSGWALDHAIALDCACPGLLAASMYFGSTRRQAFFLILSTLGEAGAASLATTFRDTVDDLRRDALCDAAVIGRAVLLLRRPRDLLRPVIDVVPVGLLGTLTRLGHGPLDEPDLYRELHRLFVSCAPADRQRVKVLGQMAGGLVGAQIAIVGALDPVLLHPAFLSRLYELKQVEELHRALAYVRAHCSGATDAAIRASLGRLKPDGHRCDLIKYWASRFDRPPCSLDTRQDPTLVVLDSAALLSEAARRYANCLKTKIHEVLLGSYLFVEYRPADRREPGVIAELRRTDQGYVLEGLYAKDNRRVRADRARVLRGKLAALGVALLDHAPGDSEGVQATARMLGAYTFEVADNGGWGEEEIDAVDDLCRALDAAA